MRKLSILIPIRQAKKNTGAKRYLENMIAELVKRDHSVTVFCERLDMDLKNKFPSVSFLKLVRLPLSKNLRRKHFDIIARLVYRFKKYDLHISHGDSQTADLLFLHNLCRLEQEILRGANLNQGSLSEVIAWQDRLITSNQYKKVVANSKIMAAFLKKRYNIRDDKVTVVYPGTDIEYFRKGQNLDDVQGANTKKPSVFTVGLVTSGNLKKRNVSFFVEIAQHIIASRVGNILFVVTGAHAELSEVRKTVQRLEIGKFFDFVPFADDVREVYENLDLFCLPAILEEFGCGVVEALSIGLPVLVSENVGASELLLREGVPQVLPLRDPKIWAEYIMENSQLDVGEKQLLSERCRAAAERYSMARFGDRLEEVVNEFADDLGRS